MFSTYLHLRENSLDDDKKKIKLAGLCWNQCSYYCHFLLLELKMVIVHFSLPQLRINGKFIYKLNTANMSYTYLNQALGIYSNSTLICLNLFMTNLKAEVH